MGEPIKKAPAAAGDAQKICDDSYNVSSSGPEIKLSTNGLYQNAGGSRTGWKTAFGPVADIAKKDWSPIIFADGIRDSAHFQECHCLYGDIDEGITLDDFRAKFQDYCFILLTSRNHQKEKHGITCDRFHVLFPQEKPYTTADSLKKDLAAMIDEHPFFDPSCKDAARFFFGFDRVQVFENSGKTYRPLIKNSREWVEKNFSVVRWSGSKAIITCPNPEHTDETASAFYNTETQILYCSVCGVWQKPEHGALCLPAPRDASPDVVALREKLFSEMVNRDGKIASHYKHIFKIAEIDPELKSLFILNTLTGNTAPDPARFDSIDEADCWTKHFYSEVFACEISSAKSIDVVHYIASRNKTNPLIVFLDALAGVIGNPLDDFLKHYTFDAPPEISQEIFDIFLTKMFLNIVAADRRIVYQNDSVIILEGAQGIGKGRTCRFLAGSPDFYTELSIGKGVLSDKDIFMQIAGKVIVEFSELEGLRKSDAETFKSFISKDRDSFRPPYGRSTIDIPRVCSFIGTTNSTSYLNDPTGARRFYPLKVIDIDFSIFEKPEIAFQLHSFYYRKAIEIINSKNYLNAMFLAGVESEPLKLYLRATRNDKTQESLFDNGIETYIDAQEHIQVMGCEKIISAADCGLEMFGELARVPNTFAKAFSMVAASHGYVNAGRRSVIDCNTGRSIRKRVWIKAAAGHMDGWTGHFQDYDFSKSRQNTDKQYMHNVTKVETDPSMCPPVHNDEKVDDMPLF